jgi:hypothetical protein
MPGTKTAWIVPPGTWGSWWGGTVTLQGSGSAGITINPGAAKSTSAGGSGNFSVSAAPSVQWSVSTDSPTWIQISTTYGSGNGTVGYILAANTGAQRNGNIVVNGLDFNITQAGGGGTLSFSASSSPAAGTGGLFTFTYSDTAGAGAISKAYFLIQAGGPNTANACYGYYEPATQDLYLSDDSGAAWQPARWVPDTVTVKNTATNQYVSVPVAGYNTQALQNTRCVLRTEGSWGQASANAVTLNLQIDFKSAFGAGNKNIYLSALDQNRQTTPWQQPGSPPAAYSVQPTQIPQPVVHMAIIPFVPFDNYDDNTDAHSILPSCPSVSKVRGCIRAALNSCKPRCEWNQDRVWAMWRRI